MVSWPTEYGGRDVGIMEWLIFEEEYYRARAPKRVSQNGIFLLAPTLLEYGTPAQKERFLLPMAAGEEIWCQGWSEPDAGSDLAGIRSRAVRNGAGDGWLLTGQKTWASRGAFAHWCFGIFRTDPEGRAPPRPELLPDPPGRARGHGAAHSPDRRRDGLRRDLLRPRRDPRRPDAGREGAGWSVAMSTAGSERGLSLRSPARYTEAADRLVELFVRRAAGPASLGRRHRPGPHGRRGLPAAHLLDGHQGRPRATPSAPRPAATRSSGPRPTWPSTTPL